MRAALLLVGLGLVLATSSSDVLGKIWRRQGRGRGRLRQESRRLDEDFSKMPAPSMIKEMETLLLEEWEVIVININLSYVSNLCHLICLSKISF